MSARFHSIFKKAKLRYLLEIKRRLKDAGTTIGFVVDFSDSLVMFHTLDMDTFRLNGYTVIREEDISQYRVFNKAEYWQVRAVRHFHLKPMRPTGVSVTSLPELLKSAAEQYALITLHPEKIKPDVCFIGSLYTMKEHTVTIEDLNCNGEWTGHRRLRLSDVTRVDFGGGYEDALKATAPRRAKTRR